MIEEINKEKQRTERLLNLKIEDKRIAKSFDVSTISS